MRALADRVRESCSMATLDEDEIVYLARVPARRAACRSRSASARGCPAYPTSMGRVLLAALPDGRARRLPRAGAELVKLTANTIDRETELRAELERVRGQGYAVVDGEREEGVRSAAAPVRDASGAVVARSTCRPTRPHLGRDAARRVRPLVRETAEAISRDIGGGGGEGKSAGDADGRLMFR